MALTILSIGLLVFFGHFLTAFFERTKIPDVLVLMLAGIVIGPVLHVITPEDFGKVGPVFTTLALIIILFEGGIHLNIRSLADAAKDTLTLSLTTFVMTVLVIALLSDAFLPVDWPAALLIGTILGGTSSAVVVPLVKALDMGERPGTVLFLESALTDVLVVVLTLALIQGMTAGAPDGGGIDTGLIVTGVVGSFVISGLIGIGGAFLWSALLDKVRQFPNTVFTTFAYVFILYSISELQGYSGAIAALTFGIAIANFSNIPKKLIGKLFTFRLLGFAEHERAFFAEVVFLVKTFFFVFLGLSLSFSNIRTVGVGVLLFATVMAARVIIVRLLGDKRSTRREAMLITALIPKGLASAVLATLPTQAGIVGGDIIQETVYSVILFGIIISATFVFLIERGTLHDLASSFFKPFAQEVALPDTRERPAVRISQHSLGLPAIPADLMEPNPITDLESPRETISGELPVVPSEEEAVIEKNEDHYGEGT